MERFSFFRNPSIPGRRRRPCRRSTRFSPRRQNSWRGVGGEADTTRRNRRSTSSSSSGRQMAEIKSSLTHGSMNLNLSSNRGPSSFALLCVCCESSCIFVVDVIYFDLLRLMCFVSPTTDSFCHLPPYSRALLTLCRRRRLKCHSRSLLNLSLSFTRACSFSSNPHFSSCARRVHALARSLSHQQHLTDMSGRAIKRVGRGGLETHSDRLALLPPTSVPTPPRCTLDTIRCTHKRRAGWLNLPMHTPSDIHTQNAHVCEPTNLVISSVSTWSRCRIASLCLKRYVSFLEAKLARVRAARKRTHLVCANTQLETTTHTLHPAP